MILFVASNLPWFSVGVSSWRCVFFFDGLAGADLLSTCGPTPNSFVCLFDSLKTFETSKERKWAFREV